MQQRAQAGPEGVAAELGAALRRAVADMAVELDGGSGLYTSSGMYNVTLANRPVATQVASDSQAVAQVTHSWTHHRLTRGHAQAA